jgi:plasmid stabilization system protein ParE
VDFKLVWTPLARDDLRAIVAYIARDNPRAARGVGEQILKCVEALSSMPEMGRMLPERQDPDIREIVRGNYRIVYRLRRNTKSVEVWRIWHGARGELRLPDPG